ncbi:50S ribosomal protein L5 [Candidatus Uhrbacteria bacterium]|nr:50S ribosomal protein L5 [Candidatus Uhrbacteria bacterium]
MTLKDRYQKEIVPKLMTDLGLTNPMAVPRIQKIVVNVGMGKTLADPKITESIAQSLLRITGQRAVRTLARKSIASFKIRQGMAIGCLVTLRGARMWDFLEKLIRAALPRVRDFRGVSLSAVDQGGNLSLGFREHVVFPEIRSDEVEHVHGLQVTVVTNAGARDRGLALFRALGVPFRT